MTRLYLLRHAKAKWAQPGTRDFDRPLDPSGQADADMIGASMVLSGYVPHKVLCSSAKRARETWQAVARHLPTETIEYTDELYSTDSAGYLDIIRASGDVASLLVVGHNPMMEDLAAALSSDGETAALETVAGGFPTSGLAVIRFSTPLSHVSPEDGYLEAFLTPRDL
ncbi:histidine phosphatase family protein [Aquamicrobium sp. LC103]|uniref:SixA phosphatase family protein n=1 Tax=Aquamicrobium sp. LC103 TaxID=1120658 RepID=UPI00063EB5F2|nr:histidine phosphatase family protein [Aquamicrobium sp. LC103]TKT76875.1 histidine phosphatase family protein [Aquamicrobium sp. LC103]